MPCPCFNWSKQRSTTFASFVGLTVKGRWPAAASAEPGPVADLIGPFRDGVGDAPAPRPGADRPRAVALVAEDMDRPGPRSSGADAGHPHRLHHGRELGAVIGVPTGENESKGAAGPVAGQVSLAGQSASGPAERRVAGAPFSGPGRVLVGSHDGGIHRHQPVDLIGSVRPGLGFLEHPLEGSVPGPSPKAGVQRGPGSVPLGHIPPGRARPEFPHDPIQDRPVVQPLPPPLRPRQQRPDELPLDTGQFTATYHVTMIHHARLFDDRT